MASLSLSFLDGLTIYTLSLIVDYNDETQDFVFQPIDLVLFVNDGHPERAREREEKKTRYIYIYLTNRLCISLFLFLRIFHKADRQENNN